MSRAIESSFFDHNMIDANKILNTNVEGDYHTPFKHAENSTFCASRSVVPVFEVTE